MTAQIRAVVAPGRFSRLGVAVSGGGDSVALLHLLAAQPDRPALNAVTVDHGLRPEAASEAAAVAQLCAGLGVPHETLRWQGWDGRGNLSDAARRARYTLMADWARAHDVEAVALGHTADDQAETFLMRLARGAGLDGLSAMATERAAWGALWLRPLLAAPRADLRAFLRDLGAQWAEDPSNDDPSYDRVRARAVLTALAPLGISVGGIADVTAHLREVREVVARATYIAAQQILRVEVGDLLFDRAGFASHPPELRRRLLAQGLRWVASADYAPRAAPLADLIKTILAGGTATLHGCLVLQEGPWFRICREPVAVANCRAAPGALWDGRWRLTGPDEKRCEIRALGDVGLRLCPNWRSQPRPRAALLADPAVWREGELVAAPLAGMGQNWSAELGHGGRGGADDFLSALLSH
ncbi:tRNA lysidine(34) synthetase TilS [Phaeovulum sp.]|uniref:tRNA lysidine(34) synthetase TilS n=1 Tax=Phaeovulum sp. TaxID=2934796 RepID=UPI0039E27B54